MAFLQPARHVRLDRQPVALERQDHDRQPGQAVRVEVAEDEHALALVARERQASEEDVDVGEEGRVVEPVERLPEEGVDGGAVGDAAGDEQAGHAVRETVPGRRGRGVGRDLDMVREHPSEARLEHVHQSDIRRCTAALTGASIDAGQETERRVRGARVVATRPCRRSSQRCQSTSSGLATKIEE